MSVRNFLIRLIECQIATSFPGLGSWSWWSRSSHCFLLPDSRGNLNLKFLGQDLRTMIELYTWTVNWNEAFLSKIAFVGIFLYFTRVNRRSNQDNGLAFRIISLVTRRVDCKELILKFRYHWASRSRNPKKQCYKIKGPGSMGLRNHSMVIFTNQKRLIIGLPWSDKGNGKIKAGHNVSYRGC